MGYLLLEILPSAGRASFGDPSGVSTRWRLGLSEKVIDGGLFRRWLWLLGGFATIVTLPE